MNDIEFLAKLNTSLAPLNTELSSNYSDRFLNIFVLGLPRSGTTLLTQLVYSCLNVECTNNLMAKFWNAPLVAARLSKLLLTKGASNYSSDMGTTELLTDPHEFSWFWQSRLKHGELGDSISEIQRSISKNMLEKLISELNGVNTILESSVIHKPLELLIPFIDLIQESVNNSLFIYISRPKLEIASSLLFAREQRYGVISKPWGSLPFGVSEDEFAKYPVVDQVAYQIKYLEIQYEEAMNCLTDFNLLKITYDELCSNPKSVLEAIVTHPSSLKYGLERITEEVPDLVTSNKSIHPLAFKVIQRCELL